MKNFRCTVVIVCLAFFDAGLVFADPISLSWSATWTGYFLGSPFCGASSTRPFEDNCTGGQAGVGNNLSFGASGYWDQPGSLGAAAIISATVFSDVPYLGTLGNVSSEARQFDQGYIRSESSQNEVLQLSLRMQGELFNSVDVVNANACEFAYSSLTGSLSIGSSGVVVGTRMCESGGTDFATALVTVPTNQVFLMNSMFLAFAQAGMNGPHDGRTSNSGAAASGMQTLSMFVDPLNPDVAIEWGSMHDYSTPATPLPVPEHGSLAVLGMAIASIAAARRRFF